MAISASDRLFLLSTIELARRGQYTALPNPRVGCLFVRDGAVIGRGWHQFTGEGHAEARALQDAGGDVRGATAYVSLEPCSFEGRTPSCAKTLVEHGVARVVVATMDFHPRNRGRGIEVLRDGGVQVDLTDLPEARALNPGHALMHRSGMPYVRIKVAASLDGRTAMASGESQWITGEAARTEVQQLRARSGAVVTGIGTVLADDPQLNVRDAHLGFDGRVRQPTRVVVDSRLRTPAAARIFDAEGAVVLAHAGAAATHPSGETLAVGETRVDLSALLSVLAAREISEVLVEAGPRLTAAFFAAGLWHELVLYTAPQLLGSSARPLADMAIESLADRIEGVISDVTMVGKDLRITLTRNQQQDEG